MLIARQGVKTRQRVTIPRMRQQIVARVVGSLITAAILTALTVLTSVRVARSDRRNAGPAGWEQLRDENGEPLFYAYGLLVNAAGEPTG